LSVFRRRWSWPPHPPPPIAWPEADLLLLCGSEWGVGADLYRYDPAAATWSAVMAGRNFVIMTPIPGNAGVLLVEATFTSEDQTGDAFEQFRTILWQDGREIELSAQALFQFEEFRTDPLGEYLPLLSYDVEREIFGAVLLDLQSCRLGDCRLLPLAGMPLWSPDGAHTILLPATFFVNEEPTSLQRAGRLGEEAVPLPGAGRAFWLDATTYGYLTRMSENKVMVATIDDDVAAPLLAAADLAPVLPGDIDLQHLFIGDTAVSETGSLYLLAYYAPPHSLASAHIALTQVFLLVYDWPSGDLVRPAEWQGRGYQLDYMPPLFISPDGRWLAVSQLRQVAGGVVATELRLVDLRHNKSEMIQNRAWNLPPGLGTRWSADGRWFARLVEDGLVLTAPGHEYDFLAPHDFGPCMGVAWLERGSQ
jgi:hypothetical protein